MPSLDYFSVKKILDKIYICKILKEEDYKIVNRSNRPSDYKQVLQSDYLNAGIKIKNFNYDENFLKENPIIEIPGDSSKVPVREKAKSKFSENITFKKIKNIYRGKNGFLAFNSNNEEIGIVFMGDDKRSKSYGYCELCIFKNYKEKYGEWHRIKSNGLRIEWSTLCSILEEKGKYEIFVD